MSTLPIVVLIAPAKSALQSLSDGLACKYFDVLVLEKPSDIKTIDENIIDSVYAYVFPTPDTMEKIEETLSYINPSFISERGPIITVCDKGDDIAKAKCKALGITRCFCISEGQRSLRLVISVEIEEFERVRYIKRELKNRLSAIGQIKRGEFVVRTRRESQNLATVLSMACPNPVPVSIGLSELLINGIEHGCLGIGHDEKGKLIEEGLMSEAIESRRLMKEYADRVVTLTFWEEDDQLHFHIKDDGDGFDYQLYIDETTGHEKKHGRGIMMAKGCFDYLEYRGNGNEVYAVHSIKPRAF